MESIQVRNNAACACIKLFAQIIESSFPGERTISPKLIEACSKYQEALEILTCYCELMNDEIEAFQVFVDDFFELWLDIFGTQGITNYIYMLGSGHIHYFLNQYKCLYFYSQQGQEALNGRVQPFIHQNSQKGGHNSGTKKGEKSYIYSLVSMVIIDLL